MVSTAMVVGLGAAGRRHAQTLKACLPEVRVVAVSHTADPVPHVDLVVPGINDALQEQPQVAVIAGPATTRVEVALRLARAGVHLLLEKPVSVDLDGVHRLETIATGKGLTVAVGYNLRFFRPMLATKALVDEGVVGPLCSARLEVGQYLPDWRPGADYRTSVSARRALGGGALLELSHELDYVRWVMGQPTSVWASLARLGALELDVEDTVEMVVTFESGAMASIHQDMLQRPAVRSARFVGDCGSIVTDLLSGTVTVSTPGQVPRLVNDPARADVSLTYVSQMEDFLAAITESRQPRVPLAEGIGALELATAALASARQGREVTLTPGHAPVAR